MGQIEALVQQNVGLHDSLLKQLALLETNRAGM